MTGHSKHVQVLKMIALPVYYLYVSIVSSVLFLSFSTACVPFRQRILDRHFLHGCGRSHEMHPHRVRRQTTGVSDNFTL